MGEGSQALSPACQKSLAEFRVRRRESSIIRFPPRHVRSRKHFARSERRIVRCQRTTEAQNAAKLSRKSGKATFSTGNKCAASPRGSTFSSVTVPSIDKDTHGFDGQKNVHTSSKTLKIHKVFPAAFSSSDRFSASSKLLAPDSDGFSSDFWLLRRRCVVTHQGEKHDSPHILRAKPSEAGL